MRMLKNSQGKDSNDEDVPCEEKALKLIIEISKNKEEIKKEFNVEDLESEEEHDIESFIKRASKFE